MLKCISHDKHVICILNFQIKNNGKHQGPGIMSVKGRRQIRLNWKIKVTQNRQKRPAAHKVGKPRNCTILPNWELALRSEQLTGRLLVPIVAQWAAEPRQEPCLEVLGMKQQEPRGLPRCRRKRELFPAPGVSCHCCRCCL